MDFSVNFMQRATAVLKEAAKLKKYKAMPLVLAIITGLLMLPVALIALVCVGFLYVLGYLFSIVSLPVQRLHKLLHDEGQSVKHAAQFIIYFLSWAGIFSAYAMLSFFLIILTVLYSVFAILGYICTLGGYKFHAFASEDDISVEVEGKYNILIPVIYIAAMGVLLLLLPLVKTLIDVLKAPGIPFELVWQWFKMQIASTRTWRVLFSVVYSAIAFAPFPKKKIEQ